ncbi:hypothetical protein LSS_21555 [Leptospira santarosai serovar Shermani str. LT 821]|uniref:Uncharacterized protein n=1 Tax=Leptospira santarosai serovar Shermani str. LT 821 TaxID=758847 RepID=A0A097ESI3_9LEPT|nr:hypothetical protein LSS_21555 [Leptospira santarosai serovar Shermani str. LT 821]
MQFQKSFIRVFLVLKKQSLFFSAEFRGLIRSVGVS